MRNVVEALRLLPGIHQSLYPNVYPNLRVRCFSSLPSNNVLFLLDGILQTDLFDGDQIAVLGTLPLGASERIEVTPGAGSSMFGADAFSVVINVVTRRKAQGGGGRRRLRLRDPGQPPGPYSSGRRGRNGPRSSSTASGRRGLLATSPFPVPIYRPTPDNLKAERLRTLELALDYTARANLGCRSSQLPELGRRDPRGQRWPTLLAGYPSPAMLDCSSGMYYIVVIVTMELGHGSPGIHPPG